MDDVRPTPGSWPEIDWVAADAAVRLTPRGGWYSAAKPAVDFLLAVPLAVLLAPVVLVGWVLVRLTSPGPGIYVQTRSGQGGRPYPIFKLRTMAFNCEAVGGIQWAKKGDARVTRVGKLLRATHLDELPQLLNVLRGEMSLVGPRPERPEVIAGKGLAALVPGYEHRLTVKPGVTGLAQIQLPADTDLSSVRHKVAYDLYYITHQTLWLDARIVAATVFKAAGMGPTWLRRLFRLPTREQVAAGFVAHVVRPQPGSSSVRLHPVG
jgi:lipopolysaccharide/colanic/teichoic acid biosynthesis glycosyltransferase